VGETKVSNIELGDIQLKFSEIVWENEPIASGKLVKISEEKLNWKKPTTYTVLRKLCEKGILKNDNGTVSSVITKGEFYQQKGAKVINDYYKGSLPAFIASFTDRNALSAQDINEIQELINQYKKDNGL
jgi:predicted transcriptional regulator